MMRRENDEWLDVLPSRMKFDWCITGRLLLVNFSKIPPLFFVMKVMTLHLLFGATNFFARDGQEYPVKFGRRRCIARAFFVLLDR